MNIFAVDQDPKISAQQLCDKHVVKMILESAQMLCAVYDNGTAPYKRAFYNHPCTIWARETEQNYEWLLNHAYAMCQEYTRRDGKVTSPSTLSNGVARTITSYLFHALV